MIQLENVQSNVLRGYRHGEGLPHVVYVFLRFSEANAQAARDFVRSAHPLTTSCKGWDDLAKTRDALDQTLDQTLDHAGDRIEVDDRFVWNLGFTIDGLHVLDPEIMTWQIQDGEECWQSEVFKSHSAFVEGPRLPHRAQSLGDEGPSAPDQWEEIYRTDKIHAVVSVSAWRPEGILRATEELETLLSQYASGVENVGSETGNLLEGGKEHFGYVDGIGQPFVKGSGLEPHPGEGIRTPNGWKPVPSGEFVIGYDNVADGEPHLQANGQRTPSEPPSALLVDGSFLVLRKLSEDVVAFREWTREQARQAYPNVDAEDFFKAKLVGRWPSGAPLALAPAKDDPRLIEDLDKRNNFGFADDAEGFTTPFGSHIRRSNPRDDPTGPTADQIAQRRIIRRALPYGPPLPEGAPDDGIDRGVLFGVINANIQEQFEFVQANWINSTLSSNRLAFDEDKDPIIGSNELGRGKFTIPDPERPVFVWDLPRFVTVRGSAYFFLPSLSSLLQLAETTQPDG